MYAEDAAIAETLLHDIPVEGGVLPYDQYADKVLVRLKVTQKLGLASPARYGTTSSSATGALTPSSKIPAMRASSPVLPTSCG
jgi:hypothetical protein